MRSEHKYYPALDGIRAIAALLVLTFHAGQEGLPLPSFVSFGQTGVDLFFVLSGFLISSILLKARPRDWSEIKTFYARRSLRIFPLYYLALLVTAIFFYPVSWPFWVYLQNFWLSAGKPIAGPGHFWSLAVEEQFYLVWPFLVLFTPRRFLLRILAALIVTSFLVRLLLAASHHDVYSLTLTRLDGLAAGGVLAVLQSQGSLRRYRSFLAVLTTLAAVLVVVLGAHFRNFGNAWFLASKYSLLAAMYAGALGWVLCSPTSPLCRALEVRPLRFVGRVSYGLYVWHPLVFTTVFKLLHYRRPWLEASVSFALVFATACLSWYAFERPFLRLKDRFAPEPHLTPQAPISL